jgi:hypothetical protein
MHAVHCASFSGETKPSSAFGALGIDWFPIRRVIHHE